MVAKDKKNEKLRRVTKIQKVVKMKKPLFIHRSMERYEFQIREVTIS